MSTQFITSPGRTSALRLIWSRFFVAVCRRWSAMKKSKTWHVLSSVASLLRLVAVAHLHPRLRQR